MKKYVPKLGSLKLSGNVPRVAIPFTDAALPAAFARAKKAGLDIAELRIDLFRSFEAKHVVKKLAPFKGFPVIATIRTKKEGGGWSGSESTRQDLFKAVLPYVNAVDIELSSATTLEKIAPLAKKQGKLLIVSHHNFDTTPKLAVLKKIVRQAEKAGADIVKIATHIEKGHPEHVQTLIGLLMQHARKNLVVIGMGREGVITRLLFPRLGSLMTFASDGDAATAPGQIPFALMASLLRQIYPAYK